jgi:hypothetical protein
MEGREGGFGNRESGGRAASHVLLIEPLDFRFNPETVESNVFQRDTGAAESRALAAAAISQHRALRDLLVDHGVRVTVAKSRPETPDGPFCNNWFSTHPADPSRSRPPTLVLYPMLAANRRPERRDDLVALLRRSYPCVVDLSDRERQGVFLESTGSLVLDEDARIGYAALSPRTDRALALEWARTLQYRLVTFTATDGSGVPYYHTNVVMFLGHGMAGICLEAITDPGERSAVETSLRSSGIEVLPLTREQVLAFCGNALALRNDRGERLFVMSSAAYHAFAPAQRATIERHGRILHTDLSAFETLGGGSARCLLGELV